MKKNMKIGEISKVLEGMEVLAKYLGGSWSDWLKATLLLEDKEKKDIITKALRKYKTFYDLPLEERLVAAGFKKDKDGSLSKTIEL